MDVHAKPLGGRGLSALRVLSATVEEEVDICAVWPIGNYALGLRWGDGHDSGIFSYDLLRQLASHE